MVVLAARCPREGGLPSRSDQAEAALEPLPDDELDELDEPLDEPFDDEDEDDPESEPPAFTVLLVEVLRESVR
ncbi:hypothetical protein GCM10010102_12350 [Promicromonospora citrea]|uniref:Uncharacterized protein n=1 Tax=Promicromonospora citrea TaxID=43677 RepID=A0A8H9GH62_9MICO|nr:hypothetical protein GCM10010102_12350 [Promicromonospora citrea]